MPVGSRGVIVETQRHIAGEARLLAQPTNTSFAIEADDITSSLGLPAPGVTIYYTVLDTGLGGTMLIVTG